VPNPALLRSRDLLPCIQNVALTLLAITEVLTNGLDILGITLIGAVGPWFHSYVPQKQRQSLGHRAEYCSQ